MSGAHTPGPWVAEWSEDEGHIIWMGEAIMSPYSYESHLKWECRHCIDADEQDERVRAQFAESEANANLIAAAPDLLEALVKAASWFEQYADEYYAKAKAASDYGEQHGREVKGKTNRDRASELRAAISRATTDMTEGRA